jgi:hypothetical protein
MIEKRVVVSVLVVKLVVFGIEMMSLSSRTEQTLIRSPLGPEPWRCQAHDM